MKKENIYHDSKENQTYYSDIDIPNSICWNITKECNDNCLFCYRDKNSNDLDVADQRLIIDKIASLKIVKLTFAGGEPLLLPNILELIQYAKEKGIAVSLTTNGILLKDNVLDFCLKNLDWLTLSLDGVTEDVQINMSRNRNHVKRIFDIFKAINSSPNTLCKIKINTLVSSVNKEFITDIVDFIISNPIHRWKLFQFVPLRGTAKINSSQFFISDEDFYATVEKVRKKMGKKADLLSISDRNNIENAYFVIFPNGDIKISNNLEDRVLGNALKNNLKKIWKEGNYNKQLHQKRTEFIKKK